MKQNETQYQLHTREILASNENDANFRYQKQDRIYFGDRIDCNLKYARHSNLSVNILYFKYQKYPQYVIILQAQSVYIII